MRYFRLTTLMLSFAIPTVIHAASIAGVQIPDRVERDGGAQVLGLNGAGVRKKFFFDIYIAALYLPRPVRDATLLLASPPPSRLLMHFLYDEVEKQKMDDTWRDGFARSVDPARFSAMKDRVDRFIDMFGDLREGDEIWIDYSPGHGTSVSINGAPKGSIEGADFNAALLGIWLGDAPVSSALKDALVGVDN